MSVPAGSPAVVIGAGPAGLMAAEVLAADGVAVDVYDAMPSVGRKFLRAGIGGLNLTHDEAYAGFCSRYAAARPHLQPMLDAFPPPALRGWAQALGIATFVGSSGRVFPTGMKAAPLLRAWLQRLRGQGVRLHVRHRWLGWQPDGSLRFATPDGELLLRPAVTVLALGGGSWPRLGSDAAWVDWLRARGIGVAELQPANCGFDRPWSEEMRRRFAGAPLKPVTLGFTDANGRTQTRQGEIRISAAGVEGGLIYTFSRELREAVRETGHAICHLDLAPGRSQSRLQTELTQPRGDRSLSWLLQNRLGLSPVKVALLRELLDKAAFTEPAQLAHAIKHLPLGVHAPRPLAEAISSAGGVRFSELDRNLMLARLPGVFVAGEMLDWEAPTGGYLLTACLATGRWAGRAACGWLAGQA